MKLFGLFLAFVSASEVETTSDETPHDPEAVAFCHNACQGEENARPGTGYCPDGLYPSNKDCDAYFLCWANGNFRN